MARTINVAAKHRDDIATLAEKLEQHFPTETNAQ